MKRFDKSYKNLFDNLSIDNDKKELIYTNIVNSKQKRVGFKLAYLVSVIALFLFTGIVFADGIKSTFNTLLVKYVTKENSKGDKFRTIIFKSDSLAEINYDADLPVVSDSDDYNYYIISDIEDKLGISFLESDMIKNEETVQITTIKNNNKIAFAVFKISNAYGEKMLYVNNNETQYDKNSVLCDIVISLKTKYSTNKELKKWSGASKQIIISEYFIKSINTTALIRKYEGLQSLREVLFDYNNIRYMLFFTVPNNLDSVTETIKFLE